MALSELVFGNETEALTFAEQKEWKEKNVKEIAEKMAQVHHPGDGTDGVTK